MITLLKNRYRIISNLSRGGFGETFLAEDLDLPSGRRCVIKKLIAIANDPQAHQLVKERFQLEAAILEKLGEGSSQIPRLYAYFEESGEFYLVQEWIEGTTLSEKIRQEGVLNETLVREILISILSVLDYVHSHHIVHRDIKPDNIILRTSDNQPVLIDFGAVKETMRTVMTASGGSTHSIAIGTPAFMPSEQSIGRPVYASDLYSLGLTAIYLLSGKYPQEFATNPATGEILWQNEALGTSPALKAILDKAIQPHPRDRYFSAKKMLDAIGALSPRKSSTSSRNSTRISTVVVAPAGSDRHLQVTNTNPRGLKEWQKAILTGSIIGTFLMGGLILNSYLNRSPEQQTVSSGVTDNPDVRPTQPSKPPIESDRDISATPDLPDVRPTQPSDRDISATPDLPDVRPTQPSDRDISATPDLPDVRPTQPSEPPIEDSPITQPPSDRSNSKTPNVPDIKPTKPSKRSIQDSLTTQPQKNSDRTITESDAISLIENFYSLVSAKRFDEARILFGPQMAARFNPNFFRQFERVTVQDLEITSKTNSSINFVGQNTYVYLDGSTQKEKRTYTVRNLDGELKIIASEFVKVTKFK
jgi:serine/threonine-protein kinase